MWKYIEGHGIVWKPNVGDNMGGNSPKPPTSKPSPLLEGLVEWGGSIDFQNIKQNSVIIIKIGIDDPVYTNKLQYGVIEQVLKPRIELLKSKKLTVLFMSALDNIENIEPEQMEQAGWVKKDKPLIITNLK